MRKIEEKISSNFFCSKIISNNINVYRVLNWLGIYLFSPFPIALIGINRAVALHSRETAQKWFSWKNTFIMEVIILIFICSLFALYLTISGKYEVVDSTFRLEIWYKLKNELSNQIKIPLRKSVLHWLKQFLTLKFKLKYTMLWKFIL